NAGLSWPLPDGLDDTALERLLYPPVVVSEAVRTVPEWPLLQKELRKKNVTLALLWDEYKASQPDGYQYSQFCKLYREFTGRVDCCMRQSHVAGEKLFVDYCGQTVPLTDPKTGTIKQAQIFVAVMGASSYTYADWAPVRLGFNYHVQIGDHFYSAPYQLKSEKLDARLSVLTVEFFHKGKRVASHIRNYKRGYTTVPEHMPKAHREYAEWTPERLVNWAAQTGESTAKLVDAILAGKVHPQHLVHGGYLSFQKVR
ncbi:MAG: hypothetical protein WC749_16060, partial [Dehalococcoidia bacterium]